MFFDEMNGNRSHGILQVVRRLVDVTVAIRVLPVF